MLLLNIFQNSGRSRICCLGRIAASQQNQINKFSKSCYIIQKKILCTKTTTVRTNSVLKRFYSDETDGSSAPEVLLPSLTDDEKLVMPNIMRALSSAYYLHIVIGPRLDTEFSMPEFIQGSTQALEVVSEALSRENYDSLIGLVAKNVIDKLRNKISTLSQAQKDLIAVNRNQLFGTFPYEIKAIEEDNDGNQRTFVEIRMVYHVNRTQTESNVDTSQMPWTSVPLISGVEKNIFACNYTFRKDYTNGTTEPWIITMCNHFMPMID